LGEAAHADVSLLTSHHVADVSIEHLENSRTFQNIWKFSKFQNMLTSAPTTSACTSMFQSVMGSSVLTPSTKLREPKLRKA
jgi:hypothetical protein